MAKMTVVFGWMQDRPFFIRDDEGQPYLYESIEVAMDELEKRDLIFASETVVYYDLETGDHEVT